jgi:hypothetical protein
MDQNQAAAPPSYTPPPAYTTSASPGVFGTKIPSAVAFVVGSLLFFLPFIEIKCNGTSLQEVNGIQLATGFQMKNSGSDNPFLDDTKTEDKDKGITQSTTKSEKKDPNMFALVALALGVLGFVLALTNSRAAVGGGIVAGVAAAGALIGLMIDIKRKIKLDIPGSKDKPTGDDPLGLNKFGNDISDKINISVDFTPWFYISVIAFLLAAFFCYRRMKTML